MRKNVTCAQTGKALEGLLLVSGSGGAVFECEDCGRHYTYLRSLKRHQKYECGKLPRFHCTLCSHKTKLKENLVRHLTSVHRVPPLGPYVCQTCGYRAKKNSNSTSERFYCFDCGKYYKYRKGLSCHRRYECGKDPQFVCSSPIATKCLRAYQEWVLPGLLSIGKLHTKTELTGALTAGSATNTNRAWSTTNATSAVAKSPVVECTRYVQVMRVLSSEGKVGTTGVKTSSTAELISLILLPSTFHFFTFLESLRSIGVEAIGFLINGSKRRRETIMTKASKSYSSHLTMCIEKEVWSGDRRRRRDCASGVAEYKCPSCPYKSRYKYNIARHVNGLHSLNPVTHLSGSCYTLIGQADRKRKNCAGGVAEYKCPSCPYKSRYKHNIARHVNGVHLLNPVIYLVWLGEKFNCTECGKQYSYKRGLDYHRRHECGGKEPRFQCPYRTCSYRSHFKKDIPRHVNGVHLTDPVVHRLKDIWFNSTRSKSLVSP
ncbi:hypothetical protein AAG570_013970 [Ranatra chinensis]|uniref:C2H2-type domain-containing protein n=1 Tax=Ranatra chinensis TaxID=642074 RepID=A0ABD0YED8_9HEMI